jgi:hypothetical protein
MFLFGFDKSFIVTWELGSNAGISQDFWFVHQFMTPELGTLFADVGPGEVRDLMN